MHVLVLHRKFKLIPIKIGFFYKFLKSLQNMTEFPVGSLAKFCQKSLGENF